MLIPQIANLITVTRFWNTLRCLHCNNNALSPKRKLPDGTENPAYDKTGPVDDAVVEGFRTEYVSKQDTTIDESCCERMEGKDGEGVAKCSNKDKPVQRHNTIYMLNEASSGIPLNIEFHRSKENCAPKGVYGKMFDICTRLVQYLPR